MRKKATSPRPHPEEARSTVSKDEAAPVATRELPALFASFPARGSVILAVSGGADSMALLALAARWRECVKSHTEVIAATVDHGLRGESKREAKLVAAAAKSLGVPHRVLVWRGAKPRTGIEAKARTARYALLRKLARAEGASHIATAHTLDDQAETVLMRLAAGSGPAGLGGMRAAEPVEGVVLLRPLLAVRKARLIATLGAAGIAWSEDPMNLDPAFARPRLRAAQAVLAAEGLTPERLGRLARRMQRAEAALAALAEASGSPSGMIEGQALLRQPEEVAIRRLRAEILAIRPQKPHRPRLEQVETLWAEVGNAIRNEKRLRRTLAEVSVSVDAKGLIRFAAAPARRIPRKPARAKAGKTRPGQVVHPN